MEDISPGTRLGDSVRVLFITPSLAENSLGRTYSLWLLTEHLGWPSRVVAVSDSPIWPPLAETAFAATCSVIGVDDGFGALADAARGHNLIVAVKPLDNSFGIGLQVSTMTGIPLLLDIDDPDLDSVLSWRKPVRRLAKGILRAEQVRRTRNLRRKAQTVERIVSNPWLQQRHGGAVVPHARAVQPLGRHHSSSDPVIAFIGTTRHHKGLHVLREAVRRLESRGFTLIISADPPADAHPWEKWVGTTSLKEGIRLVSTADIIVIPSLARSFAFGQLPAKLVDAMMAGRATIVTKIDPMPWALGGSGRVVRAGSVRALVRALSELQDPIRRSAMGDAARQRAIETFSVEACTPAFQQAALQALTWASVRHDE